MSEHTQILYITFKEYQATYKSNLYADYLVYLLVNSFGIKALKIFLQNLVCITFHTNY